MDPGPRVGVVGGGIAGLAVARFVRQASPEAEVRVFEASPRAGGKVLTEVVESPGGLGFVVEHGPNGFLDNEPATLELARSVGLDGELLRSSDAARRRYVYLRGRLRRLPESPPAFLRSDLLSWRGKLRVLAEWFVKPLTGDGARRETVAEFARRRLGGEILHAAVEPFVHGVFAGDPEELELASAFPRLAGLEREHGGCLRALAALERSRRAAARAGHVKPMTRLTSFRGGLGTLTDALARSLGTALELETEVRSLARAGAGWRLGVTRHGIAAAWDCDDVVVASPAPAAARLLDAVLPSAARELASVKSAPVAVVALGYADAGGARALDGFGFLAARGEGLRCLGALAETNVWGREPRGFLVRVMLGGTPDPGALDLSDDELTAIARQDLRQACGLAAEPAVRRVARWRAAIPQYGHGHGTRVAAVESAAAALPGLHLAGAAYRGVALNDLCRGARDVALRIAARDRGRT